MSIDKKIINEIERYNKINHYINEQEEAGDELPPLPDAEEGDIADDLGGEENVDEVPEPVDVDNDPDVEVVGDETEEVSDEEGTEELDVTELVTTQKDISDKQDEYMDTMFSKLEDLTSKLGEMDTYFE